MVLSIARLHNGMRDRLECRQFRQSLPNCSLLPRPSMHCALAVSRTPRAASTSEVGGLPRFTTMIDCTAVPSAVRPPYSTSCSPTRQLECPYRAGSGGVSECVASCHSSESTCTTVSTWQRVRYCTWCREPAERCCNNIPMSSNDKLLLTALSQLHCSARPPNRYAYRSFAAKLW
jgi:hypothetical protein